MFIFWNKLRKNTDTDVDADVGVDAEIFKWPFILNSVCDTHPESSWSQKKYMKVTWNWLKGCNKFSEKILCTFITLKVCKTRNINLRRSIQILRARVWCFEKEIIHNRLYNGELFTNQNINFAIYSAKKAVPLKKIFEQHSNSLYFVLKWIVYLVECTVRSFLTKSNPSLWPRRFYKIYNTLGCLFLSITFCRITDC